MNATASILDSPACRQARRDVAYFMRRLYRQKLTTTSGGNISCRFDKRHVAITPAALDKGRLLADQIAVIDRDSGACLTPTLPLSTESGMHLAILAARPDCSAVVHAHPATATAFTAAVDFPINTRLIGEAYALIGIPAWAPYALTGTPELAALVAQAARGADTILMENHGCTAVGDTLLRAFDRLELLEAAACMTLTALQFPHGHQDLDTARRHGLDRLMKRAPLDAD